MEKVQPYAAKKYNLTSLLQCNLSKCTKKQMRDYFLNTYDLDEAVFSGIADAAYFYKCPDRLRLPLVFYVAHPASVYINKLLLANMIKERVNPEFEALFETGVDEMSWDDTENYRMGGAFKWPELEEIVEYRQKVKEVVLSVIDNTPLQLPVTQESPWWSFFMGVEHERIHLETSSVLIRQLPIEFVQKPKGWTYAPTELDCPAGPNDFIQVPAGVAVFGKPRDFPSYGWDNEYGFCEMNVPEFEATKYPVTNREFLQFVEDGGYKKKELWTEEGWKWVQFRQAKHPTFWVCRSHCKCGCGADLADYSHCGARHFQQEVTNGTGNGTTTTDSHGQNGINGEHNSDKYLYRAMYDLLEMPWDWPVEVNYHEAKAFCHWKGEEYRMPTEAEYTRMRCDPPVSSDAECDPAAFSADFPANLNLKYGSSNCVHMFPPNALGFHDIYGNVWEWSEDQFNGLPGFQTSYLYDDFSTPCFDGRHTMMMGGSWISTGDEASRFARFSFRRHFFQHMGFRLVRSHDAKPCPVRLCKAEVFVVGAGVQDNPVTVTGATEDALVDTTNSQFSFESKAFLDEVLAEQFLSDKTQLLMDYVQVVMQKLGVKTTKVAEFGCGPGLTSFLLTKTFKEVVGVDYSGRLIDTAQHLQREGTTVVMDCGKQISLQQFPGVHPERAVFKQSGVFFRTHELAYKYNGSSPFDTSLPDSGMSWKCYCRTKRMTWVPNELTEFDLVVFGFLNRISCPKGWLHKLWEVVVDGGAVVFHSEGWDAGRIRPYIEKWFVLKYEEVVAGSHVSTWVKK